MPVGPATSKGEPKPRPPLVVIAGPTASGKSALAAQVAVCVNAEIVSADSMQVYRGLDIGTAKPTASERKEVPYHVIDVADPDEPYDAARFVADADRAIADVADRGRRVLVVGGTGLYIRALLHGLHSGPAPDAELREGFLDRAESQGWPSLHEELKSLDPEAARRIHPNDGSRILRALEVQASSGVPLSEWQRRHGFSSWRYPCLLLALDRPRAELHLRINRRVDQMMAHGFLEEVRGLLARGYGPELKPLQGLGYRRLCAYLRGECGLQEAVEGTKTDTRRFSKRQLTWFRREPHLEWIAPDKEKTLARVKSFWNPRTYDE